MACHTDTKTQRFILKPSLKYSNILFLLILIIVLSTAYGRTLDSPFLLDDFGNIVGNQFIEINDFSWNSLKGVWSGSHVENSRKLSYLTFALNYLWMGYNPVGFHVVNITIHMACALLIFLFSYQTLGIGWLRERYGESRYWLAAAAALIWVLHPVQVNAVTYIVQRMTSLAVLFALMCMTAWLSGREHWMQHRRVRAIGFWLLAFVSWCLGLLSKEHVAIVPLLIVVHEVFLLRRGEFYHVKWPWIILGGLSVALLGLFYLGSDPIQRILAGYVRRDFTLAERLLTESRVLWHYISLFFIPVSERFSLFYEYSVSRGLFSPITTCFSIIAWIGVISSAWIYRKKYPVFAWMAAWFLTSHLIESTFIPLEIIFEHRMYLPSIGLALGAVLMGFDILHERTTKGWIPVFTLMAFLCILSIATYIRNMDFRDEVTLYRSELRKFPGSSRNRLGLALALNHAGRFGEGGRMLEEMAETYPHDFVIQQNWYNFLVRVRNDHSTSEDVYRKIVKIINDGYYDRHHDAIALKNLAELLFEKENYSRALFMVDRLLMNYRNGSFFLLKGISHAKLDEWPFAEQAFFEAWKRTPRDIEMVYWYGMSLIQLEKKDIGCPLLTEGLQKAKGDKKVHSFCQKLLDLNCREMN